MSTDIIDRQGDIVEQDWKLANFKKNPIALWAHDNRQPIGLWERVRVEGGKLIGKLKLAEKGTSELIDTLRELVDQRILKAVSVGFIPGEYEAIDEDDPWGGYNLSANELMECSLCSVPANPEALSFAKSAGIKTRLFREAAKHESFDVPAIIQITKSRDSENHITSRTEGRIKMSLSDKIKAKQAQATELKNQLSIVTDAINDDGDVAEEIRAQIEELEEKILAAENALDALISAEKALMITAATTAKPLAVAKTAGVIVTAKPNRRKGHKAFATMACMIKAHANKISAADVAKGSFQDEPEIEMLIRAATDPATMTDAAWAAPLVRETWGEFMELIRDMSIYPALPGMRLDFDTYGKITLPNNSGRGKLAGSFVGEGAPIPVREGAYGGIDLQPKKMAVISTFTREIGMHSMPAIQALIQNQMLEDTAETLDTIYMDAGARTAIRPAGLQDTTETGAANIVASVGVTVADIIGETKAMIGRMLAARTGNGAVWLMNPLLILSLRNKQDAASGEFVFRAEIAGGTFQGYPILSSQNVDTDLLILQSNGAMAYGNDYAPSIDVSDQATLHMEDTTPAQIGTVGTPNVVAAPVHSMFQTDSIAVKMHAGLDWRVVRIGGIQVLTNTALW